MGDFNSGKWIVGLLMYFTVMFLVVYCVKAGMPDSTTAQNMQYSDPGYGSTIQLNKTIGGVSSTDSVGTSTPGMSNIMGTLSILTGIGSGSYSIGIPAMWAWLFSFIFFYIPFFMLLWSIYMAIPIIH
jgi:hypothetical protein